MVLDLILFRYDQGGDPDKIRELQKKRFKDVSHVDKVLEADTKWRKLRYQADNWNKFRNMCAKEIGAKMKRKEAIGDDESVPPEVVDKLHNQTITAEDMRVLTVQQIKKLQALIEDASKKCVTEMKECESERDANLTQIGNVLHPSVPISNNEDDNKVERTFGDSSVRKRYSHIDLLHMIDGVEMQKATIAAGNRCYYMKGVAVFLE